MWVSWIMAHQVGVGLLLVALALVGLTVTLSLLTAAILD